MFEENALVLDSCSVKKARPLKTCSQELSATYLLKE